jgi:membrane-associated phospholipid phosphatase
MGLGENRRPWALSLAWFVFLPAFASITYMASLAIVARREHVPSLVFTWEHYIPFVEWTVVPYLSMNMLYAISFFFARNKQELNTLGRRLLTSQIIAIPIFMIFPLKRVSTIPADLGFFKPLYDLLMTYWGDPYNLAPSLHIAFLVILWRAYLLWVPASWRWLVHVWSVLIGVSVLTAFQHHFIDVPTGAILGFLCLRIWPNQKQTVIPSIASMTTPLETHPTHGQRPGS